MAYPGCLWPSQDAIQSLETVEGHLRTDDGRSRRCVWRERDRDDRSPCLKSHRTAPGCGMKRGAGHLIGRHKGGLNTRLQAHGHTGATQPVVLLRQARSVLTSVHGHCRAACRMPGPAARGPRIRRRPDKGIRACLPGRNKHKKTIRYNRHRYKQRNRGGIMFGTRRGLAVQCRRIRQLPQGLPAGGHSRSTRHLLDTDHEPGYFEILIKRCSEGMTEVFHDGAEED